MKFINLKLFLAIFFIAISLNSQGNNSESKIYSFPLTSVKLLDGPFKHAEEMDKKYLLDMDPDRLLAPFLREAGLPSKKESYTNWENTGLDGHIGGHYLSALSLMYASTGDQDIKERLDYMIDQLEMCQKANGNGYIGGVPNSKELWSEIANGKIKAGGFDLNKRWVPFYNIHKTYAGLRDAYLLGGNDKAKGMLIELSDWAIRLVSNLSEEQIQEILRCEYGGMNETFADVAAITGDDKYLHIAHQFSQRIVLDPLLKGEDKLTGWHANTQIPKVLGFKRIADIEGNEEWNDAAKFFWKTVIENRSVSFGGNSVSEHFNPVNDFSRMIKSNEGPETCNTYNMLRLTKMLFQTEHDEKYMEYYERALYNHILSTQNPNTGGFVYFTQLRPGHYRVYSQPHTSMWCCVGSGIENHAKYGEMVYSHTDKDLYVNLFIPSKLNWEEKNMEVVQETNFPDESVTTLTINPKKKTEFTLQVRYPLWVKNGELLVKVNGKEYKVNQNPGSYIAIKRKWKKGDKVEVNMPMHISVEQLPDKSNYYSILYGPILLAAKTTSEDQTGLFADDSRGGHIAKGKLFPLKEMPIIVSDPDKIVENIVPVAGKPLIFRLNNLYPFDKYSDGMELIPFSRLHESRYIMYWAQATTEGVVELQKEIERQEQERIKLDAITVDKVICGEQQPESDHFVQSDDSWIGFYEGTHWREARGWFSYKMKAGSSQYLYVSYLDRDKGRNFDVLINDQSVSSLSLTGIGGDELQTAKYLIPQSEQNKDELIVKFVTKEKSITAKIAEVRLLKE